MVCRLLGLTIVVVLLAHSPVHAQVSVLDTFRDYLESLRVQAGIPGLAVAVIRAVSTPLRQPDSAFTVAPQAGDERGRAIVTDGL